MNRSNWVSWLMRYYRITFFLVAIFMVLGFYGLVQMPKDEFPDMTLRQGVVVVAYPGATAEEIEQQVARPLERFIFTYKEVNRKKTTTTCKHGLCLMMLELEDEVLNGDEVWSKLKHGINDFKATLPSGVLAVMVNDDFGSASALLIALESENDSRSYREMHGYADLLGDHLRQIKSVSNVKVYGDIPEQISIYVDHQRMAAYGISDKMLATALNSNGSQMIGGAISKPSLNMPIYVSSMLHSEEEIANQIIYTDNANHVVRVKDIARVVREYDRSESYIEQNGHPCILVSLEMKPGNNIVHYGEDVEKVLQEFAEHELPADVTLTRIVDQPKVVGDSVTSFLRDLILSMVIIILVMIILFPLRTAIVAAITIPLTTFISVGIMYSVGIPLNTCSLAALVLVLGMIVDNSIVVLDGYLEYLNKGMNRWAAAAKSAQHYFMPMALATLCLCAIFYPFLFTLTGVYGDFITALPWTITINLVVSLALAVIVIPVLEFAWIKRKKVDENKPQSKSITDYVQSFYTVVLNWTFRHPWLTIVGGIGIVSLSMLILPLLKFRSFPYADREQIAVEIFLPEGSGLAETKRVADSVYKILKADSRVTGITSFIGCSSPRFQTSYAPQPGGKNFAQFIVGTHSAKESSALVDDLDAKYSEHFPNAFVKFKQLDYQNVESFELRFYSNDLDSLHAVANEMVNYMRTIPDLEFVHTNFDDPRPVAEVSLDPISAAQLGLTRSATSVNLGLLTSSLKLGSIWEGDYEVPLIMKDANADGLTVGGVGDLPISSRMTFDNTHPDAVSTPLRQVADVNVKWNEQSIVHRNGIRCIAITAEPRRGVVSTRVQPLLDDYVANKLHIPTGVRFENGGTIEANDDLMPMIFSGTIVSMAILFFFLLFNFKRFALTLVCILAIGLALPGMLVGLWMMNRMLGLTSIFGLITLMGIIMRNEILIFEHADALVRKGWSIRDAAYDAGKRRMVPIFLTTATTAIGVVPMIIAATSFWMPVGVAIFAGGIGALILVVTVLPVTYWKLYDKNKTTK